MTKSNINNEIKHLILDALNLEDLNIEDIKDSDPLFNEGLGLDSIDALELGIAIKESFGIDFEVNSNVHKHFYSVDTLATFITNSQISSEA